MSAADLIEIHRCRALLGSCPGPAGPQGPAGPAGGGPVPLYGSFLSITQQSPDATNPLTVPVAITYDSRSAGTLNTVSGTYPSSQIRITTAGTYRVCFSAQVDTISGNHYLEIWPVINGTSVPTSNTRIKLQSSNESCLTVEYFLTFAANDILQLYMIGDDPGAILSPFTGNPATTPAVPAIPSMILTIMRIE